MEKKWGREFYTSSCTMNDRNETIWVRLGIVKMRGLKKGKERGRYPTCTE
jgi:hypothetical protein